jgi:hypothetical protein
MRLCKVENCERPHHAKGYCQSHYDRMLDDGTTVINIETKTIGPKGSGYKMSSGYRRIYVNGQQYYEHRYVMEQHLGRKLLPSENIHHINGDKSDNRLINLELRVVNQPKGQRYNDVLEYEDDLHYW